MSTLKSKIGAALALPALKNTLKSFDATEYGGAPLLGLNGLVVRPTAAPRQRKSLTLFSNVLHLRKKRLMIKLKNILLISRLIR